MYNFISEHQIEEYNEEVLKFSVGDKTIKTISNPTTEQLRFLGYKELIEDVMPEEREGYYIQSYYEDGFNITKKYRYIEIPQEESIEGEEE